MITLPKPDPSLDEMLEKIGIKSGGATKRGASFWNAFGLCPYDAALKIRYGNSYQNPTSPALVVGFVMHECLAIWYRTYDINKAVFPMVQLRKWAEDSLVEYGNYAQMVWDACLFSDLLLGHYWSRPVYQGEPTIQSLEDPLYDFDPQIVRLVEYPLEYEGDFEYSARLDLVVEVQDNNGEPCVVIVDHKTLSFYSANWAEAFYQDLQFVGNPWIWNKVMVPKGYPECRYMVVNGIVKNEKTRDKFVRGIYPVRQSKIEAFESQMQQQQEAFETCKYQERMIAATGGGLLRDAWQQNWPACNSRRYGPSGTRWVASEIGEFVPDGGRCSRFEYCLADDAYVEVIEPSQEPVTDPLPAQEPALAPTPEPEQPVDEPQPMSATQLCAVGGPKLPPPPTQVIDPATATVVEPSPPDDGYQFPFPASESDIVSMRLISGDIPLHDVAPGSCVYVRGKIYWVPVDDAERAGVNAEEMRLKSPDCPVLIGMHLNTICNQCEPIFKNPPKPEPIEEAAPEAPEERNEPAEQKADAGSDGGSVVGRVLTQAPVAGKGMLDVCYIGAYNKGGKNLHPIIQALYKERGQTPFYAAALTGRDPENRSLKLFLVDDEIQASKRTEVGTGTWSLVEEKAKEI